MRTVNFLSNLLIATALVLSFNACNNTDEPDPKPSGGGEEAVIYSENFGVTATASPWPAVASFEGYQKEGKGAASVTYSSEGAVTIRSNQPSASYTGASGVNNAMIAAAGASFYINDIATCGATNLTLSFGSIVVSDTLAVSYKINGTTEWKPIAYVKEKSGWGLVENLAISLPAGANTIKLKFTAAKTTYGTRIDDVKITTTNTVGSPIVDPDNGGGGETGDTLTVAQAIAGQDESIKWVKGYIVGCVKNGKSSVASANDVFLGVSSGWDSQTNVLIADSPNETDYNNCVAVNLPSGKPLRTEVNLVVHPENYQKTLTVNGKLRSYFGIAGLRDSNGTNADFVLRGSGSVVEPTDHPIGTLFGATLNYEQFTAVSVAGTQVWKFDASYGATMSGYENNTSYANEDWLVSPAFDLSGNTNPTLSFDHARGPAASISIGIAEGWYKVFTTANYTNDVATTSWTELTGIMHGTDAWAYVSSGELSLPAAATRFAFKYVSTDGQSATWEIKNIVVK
ncbi:MAG: DUF6359 domain-containing protein [Prevotellaceae bacterium]|jgi:hypothetical protein|nr:DUF6359 domain-containing protein [Prevotellaceae bacterium]